MDSEILMKSVVKVLDDKKASDIKVIKLDDLTIMCDYFVIADADNATHVRSLVDDVEYELKKEGRNPKRIEKDNSSNWIILDYQDVVVHIFHKSAREFYNLENLWADGQEIAINDIIEED